MMSLWSCLFFFFITLKNIISFSGLACFIAFIIYFKSLLACLLAWLHFLCYIKSLWSPLASLQLQYISNLSYLIKITTIHNRSHMIVNIPKFILPYFASNAKAAISSQKFTKSTKVAKKAPKAAKKNKTKKKCHTLSEVV